MRGFENQVTFSQFLQYDMVRTSPIVGAPAVLAGAFSDQPDVGNDWSDKISNTKTDPNPKPKTPSNVDPLPPESRRNSRGSHNSRNRKGDTLIHASRHCCNSRIARTWGLAFYYR